MILEREKIIIVTEEQNKILSSLLESLGITPQDLVDIKNLRKESLITSERIEELTKCVTSQEERIKFLEQTLTTVTKSVNDYITGKYNDRLSSIFGGETDE